MKVPRPLRRSLRTFFDAPPSARNATRVIVVATVVTTAVGGFLMWVFDRDIGSFDDAMWWALQTVTTVGYGDVVPENGIGRVIGSVVLVYSVAFMAILTAAITTSFVERARRDRFGDDEPDLATVLSRLDEIVSRLDRLEQRAAGGDDAPNSG